MNHTHNVTIDGKPNTLKLTYQSKGGMQYNTIGNRSAYTFPQSIASMPKNKEIRTNGITLIVLD